MQLQDYLVVFALVFTLILIPFACEYDKRKIQEARAKKIEAMETISSSIKANSIYEITVTLKDGRRVNISSRKPLVIQETSE